MSGPIVRAAITIPGEPIADPKPRSKGLANDKPARATVNPDAVAGGTGNAGAGDDSGTGETARKRGRPVGSGNKTKQIPLDVNGLEKLLIGTHAMLAALVGNPNLQLDSESKDYDGKSEAAYYAASVKSVSDHYKVEWLDQKSIDWINLLQCLGAVYGGRIFAARAARNPPKLASVTPIRQPDAGPLKPEPVRQAPGARAPIPTQELPSGLEFGEVAGVGRVQFPADHPLMGGRQ